MYAAIRQVKAKPGTGGPTRRAHQGRRADRQRRLRLHGLLRGLFARRHGDRDQHLQQGRGGGGIEPPRARLDRKEPRALRRRAGDRDGRDRSSCIRFRSGATRSAAHRKSLDPACLDFAEEKAAPLRANSSAWADADFCSTHGQCGHATVGETIGASRGGNATGSPTPRNSLHAILTSRKNRTHGPGFRKCDANSRFICSGCQ